MKSVKDRSTKGSIDKDIIKLLNLLNKKYETTSSCSGRITLMKGKDKSDSTWIYKTHTKADFKNVIDAVKKHKQLKFFYEPFIVHVKCFTEENAEKFLNLLHKNGLKKSSLKSFNGYLIEINDTGRMETILTSELSMEYVKLIVDEANERLKKTKEKIKMLETLMQTPK